MQFVRRAEWGARSPKGRSAAPNMTRGIGVHWLGPGSSRLDHGQCAGQMREIQAFHMGAQRGWADFAYNAGAGRHGYVFEGRGPEVRNAANGGGTRHGTDANAGWASVVYLEGQLDDVRQITEVLDPLGVKALGQVSDATHRRYSEIAAGAGFKG